MTVLDDISTQSNCYPPVWKEANPSGIFSETSAIGRAREIKRALIQL